MEVVELDLPVDIDKQQLKIAEELGEIIQAIKNGKDMIDISSEINDAIQACMTLHFMLGHSPEAIATGLNVVHVNKMKYRCKTKGLKIKKIHNF